MKRYNTAREICCGLRFVRNELSNMFSNGKLDDDTLKEFKGQFGMPDGIDPGEAYYWIDSILEADITQTGLLANIEDRSSESTAWNEYVISIMEDTERIVKKVLKSV